MRSLKRGMLAGWFLLLTAVGLVVFFGLSCARPVSVEYRSVESDVLPVREDGKDLRWGDDSFLLVPPEYLIRDGSLYLRIQSQRNLIVLMGVSVDDWDADRIHAFRRAHPDLEKYWPDLDRPDGGVKWLRPKSQ